MVGNCVPKDECKVSPLEKVVVCVGRYNSEAAYLWFAMRCVKVGKYEKDRTDCKVRGLEYLVRSGANSSEMSTIHS